MDEDILEQYLTPPEVSSSSERYSRSPSVNSKENTPKRSRDYSLGKLHSSLKPTDNRGDKAMNNLMDHIKILQSNKEESQSKSNDFKKKTKTTPQRRRKIVSDKNYPKITTWLSNGDKNKRSKTEVRENSDEDVKPKSKFKALDVTVDKREKGKKKDKVFKRTPSFEKYGVAMPSFEEILDQQKKFEEYKDKVKKFDIFDDEVLEKTLATDCLEEKKFTGEILDCKHLSLEDLDYAFQRHNDTLAKIIEGKKYSQRHQLYQGSQEGPISKDLRCSASLIVFSQEQIDHLLDLMGLQFDPEGKKLNYFFKVLLPDLCLLIFMDEHQMNKRQANEYLDKRPLDV